MIDVDISRVWSVFSLPDLLGVERALLDAHNALTEENSGIWQIADVPVDDILRTAEKIQSRSQIVVVAANPRCTLGIRAVLDLLQGPNRNRTNPCLEIYFTGSTYSPRHFQELDTLLEGRDFSVIVVSDSKEEPQIAYALWYLRGMLENRWGSLGEKDRIFAVTDSNEGWLGELVRQEGWNCIPGGGTDSILNAACLLPLAVSGVDIRQMLAGAVSAIEEWNLRSFENPLWLYTGVRVVMQRHAKRAEVIAGFEPGIGNFGAWYRQQLVCEDDSGEPITVPVQYPRDLTFSGWQTCAFETWIRFWPEEKTEPLPEVLNPDILKEFAGISPDELQDHLYESALKNREDSGVGVITMECGALNAKNLGALLKFMSLAATLSAQVKGQP